MLPFFKDNRYIKENEKPMFIIYKPDIIESCYEMMECWNNLAKANGFPGIYFGFQFPSAFRNRENESRFDFSIEFEPLYTQTARREFYDISTLFGKFKLLVKHPGIFLKTSYQKLRNVYLGKPILYDYEKICKEMVCREPYFKNAIPGMFTSWDKTPRNGKKATIYMNSTPEKFEKYLGNQLQRAKNIFHTDYLFITAWNEWGEGAFLEPDEQFGYKYLEAVRKLL